MQGLQKGRTRCNFFLCMIKNPVDCNIANLPICRKNWMELRFRALMVNILLPAFRRKEWCQEKICFWIYSLSFPIRQTWKGWSLFLSMRSMERKWLMLCMKWKAKRSFNSVWMSPNFRWIINGICWLSLSCRRWG